MKMPQYTKYFLLAIFFFAIFDCCSSAHPSKASDTSDLDVSPTTSTTQHPVTTLVKTKLEQLKQMEESALEGWYEMVKRFLMLIKPNKKTLDFVIDFVHGKHELDPRDTVFEIVKMNYAFLSMVVIGIIYVTVMLISGIFFFCCRMCGRCGAKDSQRQRHTDNCWRTVHKFCLILMLAFLVVPITCMCIINEHMKRSFPNIKGNATEVFAVLEVFANTTDEDVQREAESGLSSNSLENFDVFKSHFVEIVHENISNSIDYDKLEEIKNIVTWVLTVEDQHSAIANASALSEAVQNLKSMISRIRHLIKKFQNCSDNDKGFCHLDLKELPLETIDLNKAYVQVQSEFQKLLRLNFEELKSVIDKIQNNSILRSKIEEESESLKKFSDDMKTDHKEIEKVQQKVKYFTDQLRAFAAKGAENVERLLARSDGVEKYRHWIMFGIAIVLIVPVLFLSLGLICGCCGYQKDRHPTKRSSTSNCGGICLILAVYYFFLISSVLMLVTIAAFIVGGNIQTFVCIPLYQQNFEILDEVKDKFSPNTNGTIFQNVKPSKFLKDCSQGTSILHAMGLINQSDPSTYENLWKASEAMDNSDDSEIDIKLKKALLEITSGIRDKLHHFTNALNLKEMKDLPKKLQGDLKSSKARISSFIEDVKAALKEHPNEDLANNLHLVNESAAELFEAVDDFEKKLNNFSSTLLNIYNEADNYKAKIREMEENLDEVEDKLPMVIKAHLFQAIASSSGWEEKVQRIGRCEPLWGAFDMSRIVVCDFVVYPINGFWFGLGWALIFIIPTILFAVKLSRHYLRMKYDDDPYLIDSGESVPLEDMSRSSKPFSYTNPGAMSWMPQFSQHQNYMVHPAANNQARQFHYK